MNQVPWDAYSEKWTRRIVAFDWCVTWLSILLLLVLVFEKKFLAAALALVPIVLFGIDLLYQQDKLKAMLVNKPRSTVGLTEWVELRPWQTEICCACGRLVDISGASWFPNSVDRGGGRFAMSCKCGIGYFKLKPVTRDR
jgi:hypothetical protein